MPNLEFLINFDPFIMTQIFYNIFISKIGALPIILIPSFWKSVENSDHNDFLIFLILDKFSVPHTPNDVQPSTGRSPECMSLNGIEIWLLKDPNINKHLWPHGFLGYYRPYSEEKSLLQIFTKIVGILFQVPLTIRM